MEAASLQSWITLVPSTSDVASSTHAKHRSVDAHNSNCSHNNGHQREREDIFTSGVKDTCSPLSPVVWDYWRSIKRKTQITITLNVCLYKITLQNSFELLFHLNMDCLIDLNGLRTPWNWSALELWHPSCPAATEPWLKQPQQLHHWMVTEPHSLRLPSPCSTQRMQLRGWLVPHSSLLIIWNTHLTPKSTWHHWWPHPPLLRPLQLCSPTEFKTLR